MKLGQVSSAYGGSKGDSNIQFRAVVFVEEFGALGRVSGIVDNLAMVVP